MSHPTTETHHLCRPLQDALEDARRLSEPRDPGGFTPDWSARAAHVGDLSVLVLALRA